ncbi:putative meiosis protein [Cladorrhinum sp. PSN259]|nr:putative meiosis protein [Cladorrhinum sp. PSN259]
MTDTNFNPSSPRSSSGGGADSNHQDGTPDTHLTTFSPQDGAQHNHRHFQAAFGAHGHTSTDATNTATDNFETRDDVNAAKYQQRHVVNLVSQDKDPFITSKPEKQLSPTASAFRPLHAPVVAHGSLHQSSHRAQGITDVNRPVAHLDGEFSSEQGLSRYLRFSPRRTVSVSISDVEAYLQLTCLQRLSINGKNQYEIVYNDGHVHVRFLNIKDAIVAHTNARNGTVDWSINYVTAVEFMKSEPVPNGLVQIHVWTDDNIPKDEIKKVIIDLMNGQGDLLAFREFDTSTELAFGAFVEFADVNDALKAAKIFNGSSLMATQASSFMTSPNIQSMTNVFQTMGMSSSVPAHARPFHVPSTSSFPHSPTAMHVVPPPAQAQQISLYQPVLYQQTPTRYLVDQTPTRGQGMGGPQAPLTPMNRGWPVIPPFYAQTPPVTPLTHYGGYQNDLASPRGMELQPYGRAEYPRRHNAARMTRSPNYGTGSSHNTVDIQRILNGTDVRTTIMLRNIPNKVNQELLKTIIDTSSHGKYDFMYLRIDFANDCNVGYAFINFVDPLDIIDFYKARANQKWNYYKSDKTAEISYATIQGRDCLIQKFRNSSVMLEQPHYRPKLFYTVSCPRKDLAGQEEPFPPPDNQSKMKRSCENAEHVGLFTPNAGQHFRDEQRRRRSQFDRGTRLAALEEYGHDYDISSYGLQNSINYGYPHNANYSHAQGPRHNSHGSHGTPGTQVTHGAYDSDEARDPRALRNSNGNHAHNPYHPQDPQDTQNQQDHYYRQ